MVDKNRPYVQILKEERTNGMPRPATHHVYGNELISKTTEDITHYYHADGVGSSVRGLSDMISTMTSRTAYDAHGTLKNRTEILSS